MKPRILLVEDDPGIKEFLGRIFAPEGYDVFNATSVDETKLIVNTSQIDIVLLDLNLSIHQTGEGFEIASWLRFHHPNIKIIIVSDRQSLEDRVRGLDVGADDYIMKPFEIKELLARIRAQLRRRGFSFTTVVFGDWQFDEKSHALRWLKASSGDGFIRLSDVEKNVLKVFIENIGSTVTRDKLCLAGFGRALGPNDRSVDSCISKLRAKLDIDLPPNLSYIETIHGYGYQLLAQKPILKRSGVSQGSNS